MVLILIESWVQYNKMNLDNISMEYQLSKIIGMKTVEELVGQMIIAVILIFINLQISLVVQKQDHKIMLY